MKQRSKKSPLRILAMCLCAVVIVGCAAYLGNYFWQSYVHTQHTQNNAGNYVQISSAARTSSVKTDTGESATQPADTYPTLTVDFAALQEKSAQVCGWVYLPGVESINYPVVFSGDDSNYLDHSWDGASDAYGAIFVEALNKNDFSDLHTIVYGHEMLDGAMFGALLQYKNEDFYKENGGTVLLATPKGSFVYEIFSVEVVQPLDPSVYSIGFAYSDEYTSFLQQMKARSLYDTGVQVQPQDRILTLSTCTQGGAARFVVHARQVVG